MLVYNLYKFCFNEYESYIRGKRKRMNDVVKTKLLIRLLKKYAWIVTLWSLLISVVGVFGEVYISQNAYTSSSELVQSDSNYDLLPSYQQFIQSKQFTRLLNQKLRTNHKVMYEHYGYSLDLETNLTNTSSSPFFSLSVSSENSKYAQIVNDSALEVLIANVGRYVSGSNIVVVSKASPAKLVGFKTKLLKHSLILFVVSFFVLTIVVLCKYFFYGKVKETYFADEVLNLKELGILRLQKERQK